MGKVHDILLPVGSEEEATELDEAGIIDPERVNRVRVTNGQTKHAILSLYTTDCKIRGIIVAAYLGKCAELRVQYSGTRIDVFAAHRTGTTAEEAIELIAEKLESLTPAKAGKLVKQAGGIAHLLR